MQFYPTMHADRVLYSPRAPEGVRAQVEGCLGVGRFGGETESDGFVVRCPGGLAANGFRPVVHGTVESAGSGSVIELDLVVHPVVRILTLLLAIPSLGLAWFLGAWLFTKHVDAMVASVQGMIDGVSEAA